MKKSAWLVLSIVLVSCVAVGAVCWAAGERGEADRLPPPRTSGSVSLEEAIAQRRSVRSFADTPVSREQVGQLCWSGQGITDEQRGFRAAPSAGALYPVELYVVTPDGVGHYEPATHSLEHHMAGDVRAALRQAAFDQAAVGEAPLVFAIAAVFERTARKYGERAERYCMLEAGHVAQNILLQATALKLAGVPVGGYDDARVASVLRLPDNQRVLYLLPLGHPK